ncbi:38846_t:CDS:1, partial [Gigaspora margarita]
KLHTKAHLTLTKVCKDIKNIINQKRTIKAHSILTLMQKSTSLEFQTTTIPLRKMAYSNLKKYIELFNFN